MPTSRDKPHHDVATYRIPVDVRGCGIQSCLISSVCRLICFQDIVNRDLNMVHGTSRAPYLLDFWCHTIRSRSALTFCDAEEYFYGRYMRRKLIITSSVVVFFYVFINYWRWIVIQTVWMYYVGLFWFGNYFVTEIWCCSFDLQNVHTRLVGDCMKYQNQCIFFVKIK